MFRWGQEQAEEPGDAAFVEKFAVMAVVLTRPADVRRMLSTAK